MSLEETGGLKNYKQIHFLNTKNERLCVSTQTRLKVLKVAKEVS